MNTFIYIMPWQPATGRPLSKLYSPDNCNRKALLPRGLLETFWAAHQSSVAAHPGPQEPLSTYLSILVLQQQTFDKKIAH
jgi:hypothetical protein